MGVLYGYARVLEFGSSDSSANDALVDAGVHRGNVHLEYVHSCSADLPLLGELLDVAQQGDVIVTPRLSQLGRSVAHLVQVMAALEERRVGLRAIRERVDTTVPAGRLVGHTALAISRMESDLVRERTLAGLAAARRRGRVGGRPTVMGPERTAAAVAALGQGQTIAAVARALGVSPATVRRHALATGTVKSSDGSMS